MLNAENKKTNILILNSFHEFLPWTQEVNIGLKEAKIKYKDEHIKYYVVTLDSLRVKEPFTPEQWKSYINKKYKNIKFDGIYANSFYAIGLLKEFGEDFMPKIPRIFNDDNVLSEKTNQLNLSFNREINVTKTINLALKLHPKTKRIYSVEGTWRDTAYLKTILPNILKKYPHIKHTVIKDFTFEELKQQIKNIPSQSVVIPAILTEDKTGLKMSPIDIMRFMVDANPNIPMYSFLTTFLDTKLSGGHMFNGSINSMTAVDAILDYKKNNHFNGNYKYKMQSYLNWESIKKFNIDLGLIPEDVIILNKPKTIWESFYFEVISILFFILFLVALLVTLLYLVYKLKETNIKLQMQTEEKLQKEKLLTQQTKNALMGEMVSNIAHQWRQPLSRINSNIIAIDFRQMKLKIKDDFIEEKLQNIEKQTEYMSHTIDDFFEFISSDKTKHSFFIDKNLKKAMRLLSTRLINIETIYDVDEKIELNSYENEFSQVILSIINNSLDNFILKNISKPKIFINTKNLEDKILIEIGDNGGGIKEDILDKIFDVHFTTKIDMKSSGLGLYISKNIIENSMQGKIKAENYNDGILFTITFDKEMA